MIVRFMAEFETTIPDDTIEDDNDIVQFGGKAVATVVGEILQRLGCAVEAPAYAGDHGWDFAAYADGQRFSCQVTLAAPNYLIFSNVSRSGGFFKKPIPVVYIRTLKALARELASDPRFSELKWYSPENYTRETGAAAPVDE